MRTEDSKNVTPKRAKTRAGDITTMRLRRSTLATLSRRQKDLGAASLDEALQTILFRQQSYEAIARLSTDTAALADYRSEAHDLAEADVEVHE